MAQASRGPSRKSKDRMSIPMLLSEAQQNPESLKYHVFDIDQREEIQKLWQEIQRRNKTPPPLPVPVQKSPKWWLSQDVSLLQWRDSGKSWDEISKKMGPHDGMACRLRYEALKSSKNEELQEEKKNKLAAAYGR